jgi:hypothetical protein
MPTCWRASKVGRGITPGPIVRVNHPRGLYRAVDTLLALGVANGPSRGRVQNGPDSIDTTTHQVVVEPKALRVFAPVGG